MYPSLLMAGCRAPEVAAAEAPAIEAPTVPVPEVEPVPEAQDCEDARVTVVGGGTFPDLGSALEAAAEGAELVLCPGIYAGSWSARSTVHLRSLDGAAATVLDAEGAGRTLTVPAGSTVDGLTLRGGRADVGGGLTLSEPGSLVVTGCVIRENRAADGGGLAVPVGSTAIVVGSSIVENTADGGGGGVAVFAGGSVDLGDSVVEGNAARHGGGVYLEDASLTGGRVVNNQSAGVTLGDPSGGGGVSCSGVAAVSGTEIAFNAGPLGAGFASTAGSLVLTDVAVHDNVGTAFGGGGFAWSSDVVLAGATAIVQNRTSLMGGGLWLDAATVTGGRIAANDAESGGGVTMFRGSVLTDVGIEGNATTREGGGVQIHGGGTVVGGHIAGNDAGSVGGGIFVGSGLTTLDGVRVADNTAIVSGGGLSVGHARAAVDGCAVVRNSAPVGGGAEVAADGELVSTGSDWGAGPDDNAPDDVFAGSSVIGYGEGATFGCAVGCAPVP